MSDTSTVFDDIVFESIPDAPPRPPGKGREPVKWEDHLAPLESKLLNTPARLWTYNNKAAATSRMSAVRSRLYAAAPNKHWEFKVRPVPNTDLHGVYAVFHGDHAPEKVAELQAARLARRERTLASRATPSVTGEPGQADTALPANGDTPQPDPVAQQTPKERLAAKAAK